MKNYKQYIIGALLLLGQKEKKSGLAPCIHRSGKTNPVSVLFVRWI